MSFQDDLRRFSSKLETKTQDVFVGVVEEATRSIVEGSELTGAPGQPVDTGNLRASWHTSFEGPTQALIATNVEYAPIIEDNIRGARFKNHGPHSVKLTIAGMSRIVESVARRVANA